MIHAELHRKFTSTEDQFTSTVLGLLSYLPADRGLLPLLSRACPMGRDGLGSLATEIDAPRTAEVEVRYWPRTRGHGIPDALLIIRANDRPVRLVVIEAKLGGSKSQWTDESADDTSSETEIEPPSTELADQLARYWQALKNHAFDGLPHLPDDQCVVVYLTHHTLAPIEDLRQTAGRARDIRLAWLSWDDVWGLANELASTESLGRTERAIAEDLRALLAHRGFAAFRGFDWLQTGLSAARWKFTPMTRASGSIDFEFSERVGVALRRISWRFSS